jgi:transitional endoplasmic reticulum ATPase
LLEIPGTRVIWITNSVSDMDASVLRRFSFSLGFKSLNRKQRVLLWDRVLRLNRIKRHFDTALIAKLAAGYKVSAGVIDMAIKKAVDSGTHSKQGLIDAIELGIGAHLELTNGGRKKLPEKKIEENFTLEGLNIRDDIHFIIKQTERFNAYLRDSKDDVKHQMTLLLYGPPGTGKSELARYVGSHLERKIIFKRFSELQSKWVGDGEKNIRAAFEEAENEKAILVIDEIDSVLFSRGRAQHSWEISFTNEFLTAMERFRSLLICTTNRIKDLDNAAIRRFTYKVEFDFLSPEGNRIFFNQMLKPLTKVSLNQTQEHRLSLLVDLAPGDFKTVQNKYAFYPDSELNNGLLINALGEESRIKNINKGHKKIGF